MNKKGYIKTLEAVIAIIAILVFTVSITPREIPNPNEVPYVVEEAHNYIISTLESDSELRQNILNADVEAMDADFILANDSITSLVENNLPVGYSYEFKICTETTCLAGNPPYGVSVYSDDLVIVGVNDAVFPQRPEPKARIIRIWFWSLS